MLKKHDNEIIIGIDIGSDAVNVVRGMKEKGGITILDFAQKRFLTEGLPDAVIKNIQNALSSLVDIKEMQKQRVHAVISGRKLCIRVITLPVMPTHELRQAIKVKIRKYVSPEVDDIYFQFLVVGEKFESGIKKLEVMFVALQKKVFDDYLLLFEPFNMKPQLVTSACFGGWNLIRHLGLHKAFVSVMLININGQETDLTVYKNERFMFTRNILLGAKELIDRSKGGTPDSEAPSLVQQQANILYKEIELTATHHYQTVHGQRIDQCFVLGEGCRVKGLFDFLTQKMDIPVKALEIPIAQLRLAEDKSEEFRKNTNIYVQSLGALLSEPDDINLIEKTKKEGIKRVFSVGQTFVSFAKTKVIAIIFIAVVLLMCGTLKGINLYYQGKISRFKQRQSNFEDKAAQLINVKRMMDKFEDERKLYHKLRKDYPLYLLIIDQICRAMPSEYIALDALSFNVVQQEQIKFSISGRLFGKDITGFQVTQFVSALEQSGYFENVSVAITGVDSAFENAPIQTGAGRFLINGMVRLRDEQIS